MNNTINKLQKRCKKSNNLNNIFRDLKYWQVIDGNCGEMQRVIFYEDEILYQLDINNTMNVPKKIGICYGKK